MRIFEKYLLIILVATMFVSCKDVFVSGGAASGKVGVLSLNCFTAVGTKAGDYIYAIEIKNTETGKVEYTIEDHTQIGKDIKLPVGEYIVTATSGSLTAKASSTPCYSGSAQAVIVAGEVTNVTITTTLQNVKVTVNVEEQLGSFFNDYELVVTNDDGGILSFTHDSGNIGYFTNSGTLKWTFMARNADGSEQRTTETIADTEIKDNYILNFKLGEEIVVDMETTIETVNDDTKFTITIGVQAAKHGAAEADPWAKFATISGTWTPETKPEGLHLEYRADGTESWTTPVSVDDNKSLSALLTGLTPSTKYYYRTVSDTYASAEATFTTDAAPDIENMDMDTWNKNGKAWYANPTNNVDETFWASGNEGVNYSLAGGKESNTAPTEDSHSGKAARLESIKVNLVGMAAGNLYTGRFDLKPLDALNSPSFSQAYTGRPTSISFWYKYSPKKLDSKKNLPDELDKCTFYVILGNWEGQIKSSQIKGIDTPGAIAYGVFTSDETVTEYTQKTIKIEYKDKKTRPTRIIVVASSSVRGEEYIGGLGSTMFLDDMEFGWDYIETTP